MLVTDPWRRSVTLRSFSRAYPREGCSCPLICDLFVMDSADRGGGMLLKSVTWFPSKQSLLERCQDKQRYREVVQQLNATQAAVAPTQKCTEKKQHCMKEKTSYMLHIIVLVCICVKVLIIIINCVLPLNPEAKIHRFYRAF